MISLRRPDPDAIARALHEAGPRPGERPRFSYPEVGSTNRPAEIDGIRSRYTVDRRRFNLGLGRELFEAARAALFAWRHFEIAWLELTGAASPVREDQTVATLTRAGGIWFLNPCCVVHRQDGPDTPDEAAFAYGTLEGHVACGEERFSLRFEPSSGEVDFEILAFSRPAMVLTRVGRPFMRRIQRRFAGDAAAALARACPGLGATVRER